MSEKLVPCILGLGYKVPEGVRDNHDPIFANLDELQKRFPNPFTGYDTRHVLSWRSNGEPESLVEDLMKPAAEDALKTAELEPKDIDLLLGCASVGKYIVPSDLYELHNELQLNETTLAVPLGNDFSNFNVALVLADALIRVGRARNILIAIGGNWTRAVDYHTIQAYSAGDGAAGVVVGHRPNTTEWQAWHVVDQEVLAVSDNFGTMYLAEVVRNDPRNPREGPGMPANAMWTGPYFHITQQGAALINKFGAEQAWEPVVRLLKRNEISSKKITLIAHQATASLLDAWDKKIEPAYFFKTITQYANMTVANIPVNLALALLPEKNAERERMELKTVSTPYIVLLALGPDMHAHAVLLGNLDASV